MKALALFLMMVSHQYSDSFDPDPKISAAPIAHFVPGFVDVTDAPAMAPVCPDKESSQRFWVGMQRIAQIGEQMEEAGIPKEKIAEFTDARVKEGLEILHCHM